MLLSSRYHVLFATYKNFEESQLSEHVHIIVIVQLSKLMDCLSLMRVDVGRIFACIQAIRGLLCSKLVEELFPGDLNGSL